MTLLSQELEQTPTFSRVTDLLRKLGVLTLGMGALIFMLQGIGDVSFEWRHWVWVLFLGVLLTAALLTRFVLNDVKSGRIFMLLAVAVVPVQFSQLGSLWWQLYAPGADQAPPLWSLETLGFTRMLIETLLFSLAGSLITYTGFSLLDRPRTLTATITFMVLCVLMLIPLRSGVSGALIMTLSLIIAGIFSFNQRDLSLGHKPQQTLISLLSFLPVAIIGVRNSITMDAALGWGLLSFILGTVLLSSLRGWSANTVWRELCVFAAGLCYSIGALAVLDSVISTWSASIFIGVFSLTFLLLNHVSPTRASNYRLLGSAGLLLASIFAVGSEMTWLTALIIMTAGASLTLYGLFFKWRWPLISGIAIIITGLVTISFLSVQNLVFNLWIGLATGGVILLLLSSFADRFGERAIRSCKAINAYE